MAADREANRFSGRAKRYAQVGAGMSGLAAKLAGSRLIRGQVDSAKYASELRSVLGGMKGPIMKVAQIMATVPDLLPPEYAEELAQLQTNAPSMGWPFVRRRMRVELGADWQGRFARFEHEAAAAASLGQVHRAEDGEGRLLACKLQYPDMQSAVEADLKQLSALLSLYKRLDRAIDPTEIYQELGARLREELDYDLEARHMALYADIFAGNEAINVPDVIDDLSTPRLLTMSWLEGAPLLSFKEAPLEARNAIAANMFTAWWYPFSHYGVIHGDPHLGNYSVRPDHGINLLDFGCIRTFPTAFVNGVVELYRSLEDDDLDRSVAAYESWGFKGLTNELVETLNIWARFIYGPLLDDRVRTIADGVSPASYGRAEAFKAHQALKEKGPVTIPREFVFMDRAAIGLGAVFLHLQAELNYYELFNSMISDFEAATVAARQEAALTKAGVPLPA